MFFFMKNLFFSQVFGFPEIELHIFSQNYDIFSQLLHLFSTTVQIDVKVVIKKDVTISVKDVKF